MITIEESSNNDINTPFNNFSLNHSIIKDVNNSENKRQDTILSSFKYQ